MNIQQVVKTSLFAYSNVEQGAEVNFEFEFNETFNFDLIDYVFDSNNGGCGCFTWKIDETSRKLTGTLKTAQNMIGVLPTIGWNQYTNIIYIKLKTVPAQYMAEVPAEGKPRTFVRTENKLYQKQLLQIKVDGFINRKN